MPVREKLLGTVKADYDVCIIGSGAGAGPVAFELVNAGFNVVMLEKGKWYDERHFKKDEQLARHRIFKSQFDKERHVLEEPDGDGGWSRDTTGQFWGGNVVGGASNFMSAYFHRLKPTDFRLLSTYGAIEGATVADWPISYQQLEPYYDKVEKIIGVSGNALKHQFLEPRSSENYPMRPTAEHPIVKLFDRACKTLKFTPLPMARGILTKPMNGRNSCEYSGYCGSYGCHSGAKASSRAALLDSIKDKSNFTLLTQSKAYRLNSDKTGQATSVDYFDAKGRSKSITASRFVVACYSIESARLLLTSVGEKHPKGLGNNHSQVGKNLHCCAGGTGHGIFNLTERDDKFAKAMKIRGPFFNRFLQDWYQIDDKAVSAKPIKGGTLDFVFDPPSPTSDISGLKWQSNGELLWGSPLKQKIKAHFTQSKDFKFEVFCDWLTHDECYVSLAMDEKDAWGIPVAKVTAGFHPHDVKVAQYLVDKGVEVMKAMGADEAYGNVWTSPTSNLMAGGCRFGNDPKTSVLNANCQVHDCDNVYVTDGSFMPNGGSVTPTLTIYANAFRVADKIKASLVS
ncbi:GMC family oxidoreductase [Parashewanella spongiae]|uniref:GMC family oxidoreductase n=2 Tax=Parashewanella spongiae TaxID=342950 RepID=A0A3A6TI29_9GAMM|nr:GMC family oxidoreductase [Parashewanella spongiae]